MSRFDTLFAVRMSQEQKSEITAKAELLGLKPSDYVRTVTSLPIRIADLETFLGKHDGDFIPILLFDRSLIEKLASQIRRYGYHYNQANRALNTIAKKRNLKEDDYDSLMTRAIEHLELVKDGEKSIKDQFESLKKILHKSVAQEVNAPPKVVNLSQLEVAS